VSPGACEVVSAAQVAYFNHITRFRSVQVLAVAEVDAGMMDTFFADAEKYLIARLKRINIDRLAYPCLLSCGSRQIYPDAAVDEFGQPGTI